jgi:UDP-N-acetylglucosamine 2-epimerase (non-hydrolysing)
MVDALGELARDLPVVWPVHPRTRQRLPDALPDGLMVLDPLGYLDFVALEASATLVLTDSGGVQEETTMLGVPCLTLRDNTERPITVEEGTNRVVGTDPARVLEAARAVLDAPPAPRRPSLWDGRAAVRIVDAIHRFAPGG